MPSIRNAALEHLCVVDSSGSERCVCPLFWARDAPHVTQLNPCFVTASGEPLDHFNSRHVNLLEVQLRHGHGVIFDRESVFSTT